MYVTPSAPQSIGGVIDDAIRLYRHSFLRCWLLGLLPALLFGAFMIALAISAPGYDVATGRLGGAGTLPTANNFRTVLVSGDLAFIVLVCAFQGALTAYLAALSRGDDSYSLGRALGTGFARLPIFILSGLLFYLGLIGVMMIALLALLPFGLLLNHFHMLGRTITGAGIATAFGIAMVYVLGRLQLFIAAIYIDRKGPKSSLTTSWHLTKGHWWRAIAILGAGMAIIMVLYMTVVLLNYLVGYIIHDRIYRVVIGTSLLVVCYSFIYPMGPALFVAMYNDFKLRREGGDLAARVGALTSA